MNYSDYRFTLDVQIHQAQVSIPVTFNDTARRLYIGFTDGRKPYTIPDGCRAVFAALKPDGKSILNDCIIENNKTVVYEFSQNTTNAEGVVDCEIRLYDCEGKELTSPQFIIVVDKKVVRDEEVSLSESESTTLDSIIRSELERVEAEKERQKLADFLATSGGVIVSEEEPGEGLANVWVDSSPDTDEIFLLDNTDIVQELSDAKDKIPSVALLKRVADKVEDSVKGKDGEDGYSPTATVEQIDNGVKITITDKNGTTTANVINGEKGEQGIQGENGADGKTPYIKDGYWWIGDTNTNVKAEGVDGKNGTPPQVYINESTNEWEISMDGGRTWYSLGVKATGDNGTDGKTPYIQDGYWYIDSVNTNVKAQGVDGKDGTDGQNGTNGQDGHTPIKGTDYWTEEDKTKIVEAATKRAMDDLINNPIFMRLEDSVIAPVPQLPADGRKIGDNLGGGGTTPNFTNLIASDFSNIQLNKRISTTSSPSGTIKDAVGNICFTDSISVYGGGVFRINLPMSTVDANYTRFWMYNDKGDLLNTDDVPSAERHGVTLSESDGVTSVTIPNQWNGGADVYYVKINLHVKSTAVTTDDIANLVITWNEEISYTETEGGIATENADFDVGSIVAKDIFDYLAPLVKKYPNYITKEILGKDASGNYDYHRYTLCKHYYSAWCRRDYPKMFAWKNGSTVIYSVSVSPRVGDTMYSTEYIGTTYGTVTSVNCSAQGSATMLPSTRTVNGSVFERYITKDVEPTLVYTSTISEIVGESGWVKPNQINARIYKLGGEVSGRVTAFDETTITSNHATPIVYDRYPMGDVNNKWVKPTTITIWANEHQDTPEPAIIMARFIKDLCENTNNELLRYIKNNLMLVIIPVANPYGYSWRESCVKYGDGYYNVNRVNINRNFDTPGWANGPYDTGDGALALGAYGGSEIETQYLMNTLHLSKAVVGMSLHTVGYMNANETIDSPASNGLCHYQGNRFNADKIAKIAEVMRANYNLLFTDYGTTDPTTTGKSPAYITYAGCVGGLVEMQPREAIDNPQGTDGSPIVMEACYTEFLQCLYMWLTDAAEQT